MANFMCHWVTSHFPITRVVGLTVVSYKEIGSVTKQIQGCIHLFFWVVSSSVERSNKREETLVFHESNDDNGITFERSQIDLECFGMSSSLLEHLILTCLAGRLNHKSTTF